MQNKIINIIFIVCLAIFSIPAIAEDAVDIPSETIDSSEMELVQNEVKVQDRDIKPINTTQVEKNVVPDPRREGKKVLWLFFKTMLAVGFCSILLYIILLFTKKFYSSAFVNHDVEELENLDLSTPTTKQDALHSFLHRSR